MFGRLLRNVRSVFTGSAATDHAPAAEEAAATRATATTTPPAAATAAAAATAEPAGGPAAGRLLKQRLRQRRRAGTEAARPYFERAAQLEPNAPVPWFMLGNVASELGDLDAAVAHYAHARDLNPSDHVIRYNLGLNQHWRGYIDTAIEELRVACGL